MNDVLKTFCVGIVVIVTAPVWVPLVVIHEIGAEFVRWRGRVRYIQETDVNPVKTDIDEFTGRVDHMLGVRK